MGQPVSIYRKFTGTAGLMLVSRGLSVMSGVIFARYLGPEKYGLYSFVLAIIALAALPVIAGLPNLLVREIAHYHLEEKWSLLMGIINWSRAYVLALSLVIGVGMLLALYFGFFESGLSQLLWVAVCLIPLKGVLAQQGAVLNGFRQPVLAQLPVQIFAPLIVLGLASFYVLRGADLSAGKLINLSVTALVFSVALSAILLKVTVGPLLKKNKPKYSLREWHKSLLPFTLMACVGTLNTELASVTLGWFVDAESVAYFKVAMQGVVLIAIGLISVNAVIMPNVARLYKQKDMSGAQELLTKSVRLSTLVSLPIIVFLVVFGGFAIRVLFGEEYLPAYPILVVLCVGQLVNVLMGSVGLVLNMTGNEKKTLRSLSIALLLNMISLVLFVPLYGVLGAALAVSGSLICWNILMAVDVHKLTGLKTIIS